MESEKQLIEQIAALDINLPCFLMDEKLLVKNLEQLQYIQKQSNVKIICALKGFSMFSVFPMLNKYLVGGAASSLNEARLVYEEMGSKAYTYCPAIVPKEADSMMAVSGHFVFNSINQFEQYKELAKKHQVSIGLRVNPGYSEIKTDIYNPALPSSRLGISASDLGKKLPDDVEGLHFHVLCENTSVTLENVLTVFEEKFGHLIHQCKWINMGGGHYITREDYDVEHLIQLLKKFKTKYNVDVILEPGTAVALNTGYLVSTVLDIVENDKVKTAMLDTSFTCHMYDCLEMPYKPYILGEIKNGKHLYRMGGLSCLAGDFVDGFTFEEPLAIGQKLVFTDMMHYTMVKTNTFNGVQLPDIAIWKTDGSVATIRTFQYEDFKGRLS